MKDGNKTRIRMEHQECPDSWKSNERKSDTQGVQSPIPADV